MKPAARKDPNWVRNGLLYRRMMATYRVTGDEKYLEQAKNNCQDEADWMVTGGPPRRPRTGYRHADRQCIGQTYCELYAIKPDEHMIADLKRVYAEMQAAPATGRVEWNWCDSLYMAPPTLARLAKVTGDTQYLKFMDTMYWDTTDFLKDKEEHLFYRDASYFFNSDTPKGHSKNGKKVFWARGNGWVVAGLTRILDYLPADWPTRQIGISRLVQGDVRRAGDPARPGRHVARKPARSGRCAQPGRKRLGILCPSVRVGREQRRAGQGNL